MSTDRPAGQQTGLDEFDEHVTPQRVSTSVCGTCGQRMHSDVDDSECIHCQAADDD